MKLSILIFDGFTALDVVGGYEVLARVPGIETEIVAPRRGVVATDTRRLGVVAFRDLAETTSTDILYVPGGPGGYLREKEEDVLAWIRAVDKTTTWTVGICNGVSLLAAAGVLRGLRVTTNWFDRERIATLGVEVVAERYCRDGKYVTGAGVSASIDTGLYLAQLIAGDVVAKAIQLGIEYYPAPPFAERSPAQVPEAIQEIVRKFEASEIEAHVGRKAPFADHV